MFPIFPTVYQTLLIVALIANLVGFAMIALDKWRARTDRWRISEAALVSPALLGGWPGILLAMKLFRHKTQKRSFQLKLALASAVSLLLVYLWLRGRLGQ